MAYRNGTYIAFHAEGSADPTGSDIRYYRMLKAWHENDNIDFKFVNSHEKVVAVRDTSQSATIKRSLRARLDNSKNMILLIGPRTRLDTDFVPYEIAYAVDTCEIPLIVTYTQYAAILLPDSHAREWPAALASRIRAGTVEAIHIPFRRSAIDDAIHRFDFKTPPGGSLVHYTKDGHRRLGIDVK